jgi:hypothetical protein
MRTVRVLAQKYPELAGRFSSAAIPAPSAVDYSWGAISKPDGSPALRYVFDPDPKFIRAGAGEIGPDAIRDSASGLKWSTNAGKALVKATAINGKPTLTLDAATALFGPAGQATFNHDEFSFFAVINTPVTAAVRTLMGPTELTTVTPLQGSCNLLINTAGFLNVYMGSTGAPLVDTAHAYQGSSVLVLVTFSTLRGVSVRRNGVQVLKDATRVTPVTGTTFNLFSASGSGSRFSGSVGKVGVLDVDLSRPEYTKALAAIESHLMSFYGLTA